MSFHPGVEKMQFQFADCTQPADCSGRDSLIRTESSQSLDYFRVIPDADHIPVTEQPVGMQEVSLSVSVLALQLFQYRYFHRRNLVFGPVVQLFEDNDPVLPFF